MKNAKIYGHMKIIEDALRMLSPGQVNGTKFVTNVSY